MGAAKLGDYLNTIKDNYYLRDDIQLDPSFEVVCDSIWRNKIELKREEARSILEQQVDTTGLVIHTENEIEEGENENGRNENGRSGQVV